MFSASTSSFTAVTVTAPVLPVAWASNVNTGSALNVKPPAGVADTVTVNAVPAARGTVAVTLLTVPFSAMVSGLSTSVTFGRSSSFTVTSADDSVPTR